ncbi:hypothetical protein HNQ94_003248 [Salirhabdus euzebyi]|uniref:DUF541 domain-containing protein n=1 Tax=Salirhabdus euzebyi TaxID=394506 RepID=A0A841Q835_9BACI|nr:SIMPL domain-containing protein [Salirhabdus euzebyi]MBB6454759.1 hypothetical protein [Salirhabdus euzebyi]
MNYHYPPLNYGTRQQAQMNNIMKVIGEGVLPVTPDQLEIILGVTTEGENLQKTQQLNAEKASRVRKALLQKGIKEEDIQTQDYRINLNYDYKDGEEIFRGYRVVNMLELTVKEVEQAGVIIDAAVKAGVNTVTNINFTVANKQLYYQQALTKAIQNAQKKATAIAKTIGVPFNQIPERVEELSINDERQPREVVLGISTEDSIPTPIEPGLLSVKAIVEAEFNY